jgi:hypothetical protein
MVQIGALFAPSNGGQVRVSSSQNRLSCADFLQFTHALQAHLEQDKALKVHGAAVSTL